jgi:hypothetical protein
MRLFAVSLVLVLMVASSAACAGGGGGGGGQTESTQKTEPTQKTEAAQKTEPTQKTEAAQKPAPKEETGQKALVRVSGTEGVSYSGSFGDLRGSQTADGVVGTDPVDYEVDLQPGPDTVNAAFQKTNEGPGTLSVEIVSPGGEVVASQETSEEFGAVDVHWNTQGALPAPAK